MASKVYFADFRAPSWRETVPQKFARLIMTAGFDELDLEGKYVAIKTHFGEPGNMAFLRPNWAKVLVRWVSITWRITSRLASGFCISRTKKFNAVVVDFLEALPPLSTRYRDRHRQNSP